MCDVCWIWCRVNGRSMPRILHQTRPRPDPVCSAPIPSHPALTSHGCGWSVLSIIIQEDRRKTHSTKLYFALIIIICGNYHKEAVLQKDGRLFLLTSCVASDPLQAQHIPVLRCYLHPHTEWHMVGSDFRNMSFAFLLLLKGSGFFKIIFTLLPIFHFHFFIFTFNSKFIPPFLPNGVRKICWKSICIKIIKFGGNL